MPDIFDALNSWKYKPYFLDKMGNEHASMEDVEAANKILNEILYPKIETDTSKLK